MRAHLLLWTATLVTGCSASSGLPDVGSGDTDGGPIGSADAGAGQTGPSGPTGPPVSAADAGGTGASDGGVHPSGDAGSTTHDAGEPSDADPGKDAAVVGTPYYFGTIVDPGSCLDVSASGTTNGTPLQEYSCNTSGAQSFTAVDVGGGNVELVNANSKKCVDLADGGTANGTRIEISDCTGSASQTYKLADIGGGLVNIVNPASTRCLDVPYANPVNGTALQLYDCNKSVAQSWNPTKIGAGYTVGCGVADLQAGVVLAANCGPSWNALKPTALNLNSCLTNSNGTLGWEANGNFGGSCSNCTLAGTVLSCNCNDVSAKAVATSLDLSTNINQCDGVLTCGACGSGTVTTGPTAFAALYGSDGNDFYTFTGSSSVANLKTSGWTTVFLFAVSVQSSGDITYGGKTIVTNGSYVGDPNWGPYVTALKMQPTSVTRYEVTVGGWGDGSFDSIKSLSGSQGTGSGSTLYKNFKALKDAVPGIDAINDDDEQTYDLGSSTAFGQMLGALGMKFSHVPYMNQSFWVQLKNNLGAETDIVYLQCYQGGAGNDPGNWDSAYGNGFHVVPGQESNNHSASYWSTWSSADQVTGGFYWPDVTWAPNANWGVFEIAGGLGLPPQ